MRMRSNDRPAWRGVGHPVKAVLDIARRAERRRRGAADAIAAMRKDRRVRCSCSTRTAASCGVCRNGSVRSRRTTPPIVTTRSENCRLRRCACFAGSTRPTLALRRRAGGLSHD